MFFRLLIGGLFIVLFVSCNDAEGQTKTSLEKSGTTLFTEPPEWSKSVVWYQILVDRFRNGDPSNDPRPEDIVGAYPGFAPKDWGVTPWTHDWYKDDAYLKNVTKETFAPNELKTFSDKSQLRRYGGDLQGVLDKLDYLDSLGITAVYFNPLNDAPSLHKFDARFWRHIDRNFGPNPELDVKTMESEIDDDPSTWQFTEADKLFLKVVKEFHQRGIKVIMDYSWNHTGTEFWAWKDILKNQNDSKYSDWYWVKRFDDPTTNKNEFEYRGWAGVPSLPEIKETAHQELDAGVQAFEGNVFSEEAKEHIYQVTKRWLDPNGDGDTTDGVDGFRLDVAAEMPIDFWHDYRKKVREINPEAYLVGEVWWEEWPDKLLDPKPFVDGKVFDAVMNYRWFKASRHFFNAAPEPITVSAFIDSLKFYHSTVRKGNNYAMMNLVASHDVPRVLTSLYNKNKYKYNSSPGGDSLYKINKPDKETFATLRLLLAHQFTYVGAPHIWAGDEMGMWGADDPSNRKPLIWPDYTFEDEKTHPLNQERPIDEVKFDKDLFQFYQELIRLRKENPVLMHGNLEFIAPEKSNGLLAYRRYDEKSEVIAVFNHHDKSSKLQLDNANSYKSLLGDIVMGQSGNGKVTIEIPPRKAAIVKRDE